MIQAERDRINNGKKRKSKINKKLILKSVFKKNCASKKFIDYLNRANRVFKNEKSIKSFRRKVKEKIFSKLEKY